jgi:hypothetical protein
MGPDRAGRTVTCIACGEAVPRDGAREYDKYGDRWDRDGKTFEYFCKACFRDLVKQPRSGLEDDLEAAGAGQVPDTVFFELFLSAGEDVENEPE